MNTNRVYDISNRAMLVISVAMVLMIPLAIYFANITSIPREATGLQLCVVAAVVLWIYTARVWIYGSKTAQPC